VVIYQPPLEMEGKIAFENGRISDFQGLVTLTLDRVMLHTVMHHLSTSTYIPTLKSKKVFVDGRTDVRTDGHLRPALLCQLGGVDLKKRTYPQNANVSARLRVWDQTHHSQSLVNCLTACSALKTAF